jgi:hypothetical protein
VELLPLQEAEAEVLGIIVQELLELQEDLEEAVLEVQERAVLVEQEMQEVILLLRVIVVEQERQEHLIQVVEAEVLTLLELLEQMPPQVVEVEVEKFQV